MKHRERRAVTTALVRLRLGLVGLALAGSSLLSQSPPIVDGTGGRIGGEHLAGGGAAFKGIPYAEPPVGDLRWREPMPVRAWSGTRDATSFSAICPQNSSATIPNAQELLSEDCLYVNVWTPEWPVPEVHPKGGTTVSSSHGADSSS
jgi:para-nitrobenzyl esterase